MLQAWPAIPPDYPAEGTCRRLRDAFNQIALRRASMTYRLHHTWGLDPLPDFDGEQWIAMLPPLLRAWLGADRKPRPDPRPKPDARAVLERQLRRAEAQADSPAAPAR